MTKAKTVQSGKTYEHSNLGAVRVIEVASRGVIVLQTTGRDGQKSTAQHRVAKRDLYEVA